MATDVRPIPKELIKLRWKEPYVSGGLNQKLAGVIPAGIYRGLLLSAPGSGDRTVSLDPDPETGDHLAVFESDEGFSTTYREEESSTTIVLDGFESEDVVITLYVDYEIDEDTEAFVRVYTLTEFNALLDPDRDELVVLGTVAVPAAGASIPADNITYARRTYAWERRPISSMNWVSALKNASFEHGPLDDTSRFAVTSWVTGAVNGDWRLVDTGSPPGRKALEWRVTTTAPFLATGSAKQLVDIPVREGQLVKVQATKRVILAANSGVARITVEFRDHNGEIASWSGASLTPTSIDGGPTEIEATFPVPADAHYIYKIGVTIAAEYGSTGTAIQLQGLQAWIEPNAQDVVPVLDRGGARQVADLLVADSDATSPHYENLVGLLRWRHDTPTGEGSFSFQRKDQDANPALHVPGRIEGLGDGNLADATAARIPRASIPVYDGTSSEYTLVQEYSTGGTDKLVRQYTSAGGVIVWTVNASWDGSIWTRDISGEPATFVGQSPDGFECRIADPGEDPLVQWKKMFEVESDPPLVEFGSGWRGSIADDGDNHAGDARISIPPRYRAVNTFPPTPEEITERTLLAISSAGLTNGRSVRVYRKTVSVTDATSPDPRDEELEIVFNATYSNDGGVWSCDDVTQEAQRYRFTSLEGVVSERNSATPGTWSDGGWERNDVRCRHVLSDNGYVDFGNTSNIGNSNPAKDETDLDFYRDRILAKNTPKAWALVKTGASPEVVESFNIDPRWTSGDPANDPYGRTGHAAGGDDLSLDFFVPPINATVSVTVAIDAAVSFNAAGVMPVKFKIKDNVLTLRAYHINSGGVFEVLPLSTSEYYIHVIVFGLLYDTFMLPIP